MSVWNEHSKHTQQLLIIIVKYFTRIQNLYFPTAAEPHNTNLHRVQHCMDLPTCHCCRIIFFNEYSSEICSLRTTFLHPQLLLFSGYLRDSPLAKTAVFLVLICTLSSSSLLRFISCGLFFTFFLFQMTVPIALVASLLQ